MKKILIISGTSVISGAEYVLGDFLKETTYKNDIQILHSDINIVSDFYKNFSVNKIYKSNNLNPVGCTSSKYNFLFKIKKILFSFFDFYKIFKDNEISTVLGNNTGDVIYSYYSYFFKKKHINYIHDILQKDSLLAKTVLFFDNYINEYVVVSNAVKNSLIHIGIKKNKINVIYNGLHHKEIFLKKNLENKIVFGFIGNIEQRKNPLEFIEFIKAAQEILPLKIESQMVFGNIIDKNLFKELHEIINKEKLPIKLLGKIKREEIDFFYEKLHFLVLTSKNDPLPTVVLESLNNGVPVIGHNIDGIPEIIINEYNGFLYNSVKDFKKILEKILKIDYIKMQENANTTIKNKFSLTKRVKSLNSLLFNND